MTANELQDLYDVLGTLLAEYTAVEDRHTSSAKGHLADTDYHVISLARLVIFRLMMWRQYPAVSPESYLPPLPPAPTPQSLRAPASATDRLMAEREAALEQRRDR